MPLTITALAPLTAAAQTAPAKLAPAGCLSGYPNGTYQGDRPATRNELAAGTNACLEQVNRLLPFNKADFATRADFNALIQRQRELNEQLRALSDRVGTISPEQSDAKPE